MGCASSKIDDLPAVELCRERLGFLNDALNQRYVFSAAHVAYLDSLKSVGVSLRHFFDVAAHVEPAAAPPSPVLNLPPRGKGKPKEPDQGEPGSPPPLKHHLPSGSDGHISFHSDSDSDLTGSDSPFHHDDDNHHHLPHDDDDDDEDHPSTSLSPPLRPQPHHLPPPHFYGMYDNQPGYGGGFASNPNPNLHPYFGGGGGNMFGSSTMHMNFMKKQPTPSVTYQQRPPGAETVHMGMGNSLNYSSYPPNHNPSSYYSGNDPYNFVGGGGGFFGGPSSYDSAARPSPYDSAARPSPYDSAARRHPGEASTSSSSKAPPPPPPPPPAPSSTWDFFNLFETTEDSYPPYTPSSRASRDSRELREAEGIPDLEDEDYYQEEVVKEVHGHQKFVDGNGGASTSATSAPDPGKGYSSKGVEPDEIGMMNEAEALYNARPKQQSSSPDPDPVEYEVHMVDKKVVREEENTEERGNPKGRGPAGFRNLTEVLQEIQVQFERAASSGAELAKMLEVGRLPYHRKHAAYHVSSKMLQAITPSLPSISRDSEASSSAPDNDEDLGLRSRSLSATLQKLHLWEKKLLEEVKVEEKMRVVYDRKLQRLKRLDERGAESHKIDATRTLVKSLSTKIRISIQIVDKISVTISKLRDEELCPQLHELIQGLTRMWRSMLDCHQHQCQAVEGARGLDALTVTKTSDSQLEAVLQLERELLTWTSRFYNWVSAQKGFVKALNYWLRKCINTDPIDTPDGPAPFSPERAGAPPIFVICDQWAQSIDQISEKEVLDSMRVFAAMVFQFWERDKGEMRQRMLESKDMERKVKNLEREDLRIQKEIQALDKKVLVGASGDPDGLSLSGNVVYQSDTSNKTSLHAGLLHIFEAMDRFSTESLKAYEELLERSEGIVKKHERGLQ